ncbi:hypothetical protein BB559_006228 [Furculomyces boomerangus]|uniref:Tc1-like transposase DDE domain-containing protein n=1 Tax=Furculomyces boomerangus TaxID=61424 RepID=A0A2T9Y422_9FUNG|nr:hypothetical protein BB559_006228 [Furculomyces boomerangus]
MVYNSSQSSSQSSNQSNESTQGRFQRNTAPIPGKYKKTDPDVRIRIMTAGKAGKDWRELARANSVNINTAASWLESGHLKQLPKGRNGTPSKISEPMTNDLINWISGDSKITLKMICVKLFDKYAVQISQQVVSKHLNGMKYTSKKSYNKSNSMNTPENKIMIIDDTRAVNRLPNSKGPNFHMLGALCYLGLVHLESKRRHHTKKTCSDWCCGLIKEILGKCVSQSSIVLVCDNASIHGDLKNLESVYTGLTVLHMSPYSPMLNPIENA